MFRFIGSRTGTVEARAIFAGDHFFSEVVFGVLWSLLSCFSVEEWHIRDVDRSRLFKFVIWCSSGAFGHGAVGGICEACA